MDLLPLSKTESRGAPPGELRHLALNSETSAEFLPARVLNFMNLSTFLGRSGSARLHALAPVLLLLAGCGAVVGGGEGANAAEAANEAMAEGLATIGGLSEVEAAALADEAAADEAADTDAFGGNAAAGETGNGF
jgi:hypothetical protein